MQNNLQLETIEINPKKVKPKNCIIWLHGLGADGYDFVDIVPQLNLPDELGVRFVFPHAPVRPVTCNAKMRMRAWFDIEALDGKKIREDVKGITESAELIDQLIAKEIATGIKSENIILAGFSQGAAMALHCGLRYPQKLGGILALSGFLLFGDKLAKEKNSANQNIPILMLHGIFDEIVKIAWAEESYKKLLAAKYPIQFIKYPMQHNICSEEIACIASWLRKLL